MPDAWKDEKSFDFKHFAMFCASPPCSYRKRYKIHPKSTLKYNKTHFQSICRSSCCPRCTTVYTNNASSVHLACTGLSDEVIDVRVPAHDCTLPILQINWKLPLYDGGRMRELNWWRSREQLITITDHFLPPRLWQKGQVYFCATFTAQMYKRL